MPQTWRSVCIAENAPIRYLCLGPQNEAKLAHKDDQLHCDDLWEKKQNNGSQAFTIFFQEESALKEMAKSFMKKKQQICFPVHEGKSTKVLELVLELSPLCNIQ